MVLIIPSFAGCSGTTTSKTFTKLLNLVPASVASGPSPINIILIDYASMFQDINITFTSPKELANKVTNDKLATGIAAMGSDITGFGRYMLNTTITDEYVGYNVADVDAEVQFGIPPANCVAAIGKFSPQATKDAFSNRDRWPSWARSKYVAEEYQGVTIHSWGSGLKINLQERLCPPHIDVLGRAKPLAITDKYLFLAASVDIIKLLIDTSNNKLSSLADLPEYASIADGLADLKAYAAYIGEASLANYYAPGFARASPQLSEEQRAILLNNTGTRLKKFQTLGSGLGRDEKGIYTAIVLYHEDSDDARENVSLLKQRIINSSSVVAVKPWSEIISDTDIKAKGNILLAKLYTESASFWASWIVTHDTLLLYAE